MVLISIGCALPARTLVAEATARTAVRRTIENTMSEACATARGVSAQSMPASISFLALSLVRFQPVTL
jgi:hypothetical protein